MKFNQPVSIQNQKQHEAMLLSKEEIYKKSPR